MRLVQPYDDLEVGEFDNFGMDFTADIGNSTMLSAIWTCTVWPFGTATDPNPQSRVVSSFTATTAIARSKTDGSQQTVTGFFAVMYFGGAPATMAGGWYVLDAQLKVQDPNGNVRTLQLNSKVRIVMPGI